MSLHRRLFSAVASRLPSKVRAKHGSNQTGNLPVFPDRGVDREKGKNRLVMVKTSELNRKALYQDEDRFRLATLPPPENTQPESSLHLRESIQTALTSSFKIPQLSSMQQQAISAGMQGGARIVYAAETGSGKTLGFLLPIMEKMKREEEGDDVMNRVKLPSTLSQPRAVVLAPSAELVHQIGTVAKQLSHHIKLRVGHLSRSIASSPTASKNLLNNNKTDLDLLVTTPHQLLKAVDEGRMGLDRLRHLVVDEADSMLVDGTFGREIERIRMGIPTSLARRVDDQLDTLILASATISQAGISGIRKQFPGIKFISSPDFHKPIRNNRYRFLTVEGPGDAKVERLISLLDGMKESSLIFCNSSAAASILHGRLDKHFTALGKTSPGLLHGYIPETQRLALLHHARSPSTDSPTHLICTDLMARGLDTLGWIQQVILFEFPRSPSNSCTELGARVVPAPRELSLRWSEQGNASWQSI